MSRVQFCAVVALMALLLVALTALAGAATDLSKSEARKLIAHVAGIELSSHAVEVKDVQSLGSSATVTAVIETVFRFVKDDQGKWRVAELRTGDNRWEDVDLLVRAINAEKAARAHAELETLATALEAFHRERGFYVVADSEAVLVDQLSPHYVQRVIRVDPWHHPYAYHGTVDGYTLSSAGPDGKEGTADDVMMSKR